MAIHLQQDLKLKLSQQLIMTPQLQQAIKLLQLSRLEMIDMINQELVENPTLDEYQDAPDDRIEPDSVESEYAHAETPATEEIKIEEKLPEDIDWSNYIEEYSSLGKTQSQFEYEAKDAPRYETFIAGKESLEDHLLWQFLMKKPNPEAERIGSMIIGNLNRDGYLTMDVDAISQALAVSPDNVEDVLYQIQRFDPPGVCSRDLGECLLNQAELLGIDSELMTRILTDHMKHLENKNYKAICRALKVTLEDVVDVVNLIRTLEPRPGRRFAEDESIYITPDIYVYKIEDEYVVMLNDDGLPKLRINPYYKKAIDRGEKISDNAKAYLDEKMRSATWLIKSIHQRQKTIYNVMQSILKFQREFFDKGIAYLKPMVLRDVAQDIDMHESTISRVTTNKYAYTPQGIFELKYFFNSSINRVHGAAIASASVQEKIKKIIEREDPKKPFSDEQIATILKDSNVDIARRTVAKYRDILKILPSSKRRQP
ncbi:MAG: RNA polymerase sigma-54 factor [Deltaproteobacteria bacterium]|nr:MAG: RNA polymerase sigma-54 factor [Deltaproteobacteria bacterium]